MYLLMNKLSEQGSKAFDKLRSLTMLCMGELEQSQSVHGRFMQPLCKLFQTTCSMIALHYLHFEDPVPLASPGARCACWPAGDD